MLLFFFVICKEKKRKKERNVSVYKLSKAYLSCFRVESWHYEKIIIVKKVIDYSFIIILYTYNNNKYICTSMPTLQHFVFEKLSLFIFICFFLFDPLRLFSTPYYYFF